MYVLHVNINFIIDFIESQLLCRWSPLLFPWTKYAEVSLKRMCFYKLWFNKKSFATQTHSSWLLLYGYWLPKLDICTFNVCLDAVSGCNCFWHIALAPDLEECTKKVYHYNVKIMIFIFLTNGEEKEQFFFCFCLFSAKKIQVSIFCIYYSKRYSQHFTVN